MIDQSITMNRHRPTSSAPQPQAPEGLAEEHVEIESSIKDARLVQQRRDQIVHAACKLFARRGYYRTTMKEIAEASGLAFGSLYSYFESKEDVLYMVFDRVLSEKLRGVKQMASAGGDMEEELRKVLRFAAQAAHEKQNDIQLLYRENATLKHSRKNYLGDIFKLEREYIALIKGVLDRGIEQGVFRRLDTHLVANLVPLVLAIWPLKRWNVRGYSAEQVTEEVVEFIVRGIKAEVGSTGADTSGHA